MFKICEPDANNFSKIVEFKSEIFLATLNFTQH